MFLKNCRLISELSDGVTSDHGTVEIENGLIKAVSPDDIAPADAVDCGGKTLLPGLIDMHTHLTMLSNVGKDKLHDRMGMVVAAARHASHYLDHGFTTVRDCGSTFRAANYVRDMVSSGILDAPDIISCGLALMPTDVEPGRLTSQHVTFVDGADEVRKATRTEIAAGAQYVKIFASGAASVSNGKPSQCIMTPEEVRTIVETAERKERYVSAHCHSDDSIRMCIENGVRTIEHATLITESTLELALKSESVILIPTLAVMHISDGPMKTYWQARLGPMFEHCTAMMHKAYTAGAELGFGTDCAAIDYSYEHGIEFRYRKENCGMKDLDILLQATKINARIAGLSDCIGEIKTGLKADLILVNGKPDEDISAMYQRPCKVWKNGKLVRANE